MSVAVSDDYYERMAIEATRTILTQLGVDALTTEAGWERFISDVFDLTDALCAELGRRLERNHKEGMQ